MAILNLGNNNSAFSGSFSGSYVGDGSGLTGVGGSTGAFGISDSSGEYTYYSSLSASMAAAVSGDVVEVFADTVVSGSVALATTILFKNGVNIQGNGHSYTLNHSSSLAAFADYLTTETSGTSISASINNLRINRLTGDSTIANNAATIIIHNDTSGHDTFLDLRGSEITNNTSYTYLCSYKHGRVLGGKFIGNHSGQYFLSAAQVQSTGTHNLTDVYCESEDGYAQVDDAGNSTFASKNNTAAIVTQGDFVGCTFVSNASSPSQNGAAVTQAGSITGAKLKNCNIWCNGSGTTAVYGVEWIENCSIVNARYFSLNYAIDTGGAESFTLLNSSVYSNAGSAIKVQDGGNTGTLRILNNTIHNDRYSTYGAYPTIYLQGWDNDDTLIANNSIYHDGPYKAGDLANAIEVHSGGGSNYTFNIINNTIKVNQYDAFCISSSAAVAPNIVYAQNSFEGANVPIAPSITQLLTNVPDNQGNIHVTSSLNNDRIYSGSFSGSYLGDGSQLTGISTTPFPFTGDAQITGSLTVSSSFVDFSGLTNIKTKKAAITSDHVPGQTITSASFYDSFVDALNSVNTGETIHLLSNDSSSLVGDAFSNISCSIQGNGFTFSFVAAPANYYTRFQFSNCSLDMYDFTLERNPPSNVSGYTWGAMQFNSCTLNLNNSKLKTSGNTSILLEGDNNYIRGGRIDSDNTSDGIFNLQTLTYGADDNTIIGVDFYTDQGAGLYVQGERATITDCTITAQNQGLYVNGHTASILGCTVNTDDGTALTTGISLNAPSPGSTGQAEYIGASLIQGCTVYSGHIYVGNDVYANIADSSVYCNGGYYGIQHLGTGSIKNSNATVEGINGNYGWGIWTQGSSDMLIENCTATGRKAGIYADGNVKIINSIGSTIGGEGGIYITDGNGIYLDNVTGRSIGNTQTAGVSIALSSSANGERNFITNVSALNDQDALGSYENLFNLTAAPDSNVSINNISAIYHNTSGDAGTSYGIRLIGLTGSAVNGVYVEGMKYPLELQAISSSITNGTVILKPESPGYGNNISVAYIGGDQNILDNVHFVNEDPTSAVELALIKNTQTFQNCTFTAKDASQYAIIGDGDANVNLINNTYEVLDLAYITASNVTDITTGFIDGKGNWHRSQVTSSFDHIEATTFKGDGSGLSNLPASNPFPFTGDAQITGSLEITGSLKMIRPSNKLDLSIGSNIIIGREAGNSISDDRGAIFLGYKAGYTNTSPSSNIAIGYGAGGALGTNASANNIFMGYLAGAGNTSIGSITSRMVQASNNIGMGYQALLYLTSGDQNIALGASVMRNISTGGNNIAFGAAALYNTDSGDNNIGIGYYAGSNQTSGDGNITIGSGSLGIAGESNQLRIGNGNGDALIHGDFDSGSITFNISGSDAFQVIGSEGTIFKLEDDLDGTLFTVNDRSGIPMFEVSASGRIVAEEGESIIRSQRPMVTHTADFSITSSLDFAGKYHTIGGDLTCSINTGSLVPAGAEFEFFQTSSAGNFLFITGGLHVDLIAKNDNRNLAGRGSGATLKYIGGSTFHLVGDLT